MIDLTTDPEQARRDEQAREKKTYAAHWREAEPETIIRDLEALHRRQDTCRLAHERCEREEGAARRELSHLNDLVSHGRESLVRKVAERALS